MTPDNKPDKEMLDQWHRDPNNWILGVFYYNPKDKRIFPPKRIAAFGWTINFANPYSLVALVAVLLLIFLVVG